MENGERGAGRVESRARGLHSRMKKRRLIKTGSPEQHERGRVSQLSAAPRRRAAARSLERTSTPHAVALGQTGGVASCPEGFLFCRHDDAGRPASRLTRCHSSRSRLFPRSWVSARSPRAAYSPNALLDARLLRSGVRPLTTPSLDGRAGAPPRQAGALSLAFPSLAFRFLPQLRWPHRPCTVGMPASSPRAAPVPALPSVPHRRSRPPPAAGSPGFRFPVPHPYNSSASPTSPTGPVDSVRRRVGHPAAPSQEVLLDETRVDVRFRWLRLTLLLG